MASLLQAFLQFPHLSLVMWRQCSLSMVMTLGTACMKGMYIAFLLARPISNSLGTLLGHFSRHSPQPVHIVSSTYLAFFWTFPLKLPTFPSTPTTSA